MLTTKVVSESDGGRDLNRVRSMSHAITYIHGHHFVKFFVTRVKK